MSSSIEAGNSGQNPISTEALRFRQAVFNVSMKRGKMNGLRPAAALGGLAFAVALTLTSPSPSMATQQQVLPTAAGATCGAPEIHAWYDSDQFGTYLKVWFSTPSGCKKGGPVAALNGKVRCMKTGKIVYNETETITTAPAETLIDALPSKRKCGSFYATAVVTYVGASEHKDTWEWKWGNYPA
ncbi:hypothetical protein G5C51_26225 [Streptomyces sp. A7024]|uniref:Uncharacterized protein n=1 Tax=Streptomyces coryli TaxID=1128680 RepID=A0A6G4U572_9ACTN|nr:hypothetical protein [Streptomyces coryli]NGN67389.1 hypothetical protein [Streptomyces coryli]